MRFLLTCCVALTAIGCGGAFSTSNDHRDSGLGGGAAGGHAGAAGDIAGGTGGASGHAGGGAGGGTGGITISGGAGGGAGFGGTGGGVGGNAGSGGTPIISDAGVDWTACDGPGQCVAVQSSCCGVCGMPELSNFVAVNQKYSAAYSMQKCGGNVACPACVTADNPNIAAHCIQGHCQAFDVRATAAYSSCTGTEQCVLRAGLGCCECGATGWVSVSLEGRRALATNMCAANTACAQCVPVPPDLAAAICLAGFCQVTSLLK